MINLDSVKMYCRDDVHKIDNYEEAVNSSGRYDVHHKLELTISNEFANSSNTLKRLGMYYNRPYFELEFISHCEHQRLHCRREALDPDRVLRKHNSMLGHETSESCKTVISSKATDRWAHWKSNGYAKQLSAKISESVKRSITDEMRRANSEWHKGRKISEDIKKKMLDSHRIQSEMYRAYKKDGGELKWNDWLKSQHK